MPPFINIPQRSEDSVAPFDTAKGTLASKTVWGGLLSSLPFIVHIVQQFGYLGALNPAADIPYAISAIGGLLAIYGRLTADKKIKGIV